MAQRIVVDPVTRIEGHLRMEAVLDGTKITDAVSSGTIFRGLEIILKGRDPRDAWAYAQRICGVCTHTHALASIRSVEDALKIKIPKNANIIRNIMAAAQDVHDHTVHFYHLHGFDWIDVVSALKADPAQTSAIAASISDWHLNSTNYFKDIQAKVQSLVESGQLGIFAQGYWGHSAYRLPAEVNLLGVAHYIEALNWQKELVKIHAVFGGKNPHPNYVVGGVPCSINLNDNSVINIERLSLVKAKIDEAKTFVEQVYLPDIMAIAGFYKDQLWGKGVINYMSYGDFPKDDINDPASFIVPRGIVMDGDMNQVHDINLKDKNQIQEFVSHSWFNYTDDPNGGLHPWDGKTVPKYDGPTVPYTQLDETKGYTWSKAPRWNGKPMEVGPLARCVVSYAKGDAQTKEVVDNALAQLGLGIEALHSTLGRTLARALEAKQRVNLLSSLYDDLIANLKTGDTSTFNKDSWDPESWPATAEGVGFCEAPRGSLGHWIKIKDQKIENYQAVVPTTWNGSPRDAQGQKGAYEVSVIDSPMADAHAPLELLRTIHSYDPCIACATHLLDP
ncbi:MAG: nickel-dependent hydrogenase large subunit, partial [Gracilibacteraceae bacterium]|nr:nickel-dependent hydrogenase large subunit [Gracilibacteraceae bacterium]